MQVYSAKEFNSSKAKMLQATHNKVDRDLWQ